MVKRGNDKVKKRIAKFFSNGIVTAILFLFGVYLISPSITGHVVGGMSITLTSVLGIALIIIAIGGHYFFVRFLNEYI